MARRDNDSIIVGALHPQTGNVTHVWRYTARRADEAEAQILSLVGRGRMVRVTFLKVDTGVDTLTDEQRAALNAAAEQGEST